MTNLHETTDPWTWDTRAREALLPILGEKETKRVMERIKGGGSAYGTTFRVAPGKNEAVAEALSATYPDDGYCASYSAIAKGRLTVTVSSRSWDTWDTWDMVA